MVFNSAKIIFSVTVIVLSTVCRSINNGNTFIAVQALSSEAAPPKKYYGGAGVGRLVVASSDNANPWNCAYDTVLVERVQGKPKTAGGLFVPQDDLPKLHLSKVLSVGPGRLEENGLLVPMPSIAVGDYVIAKNPWGIGPKDEETTDGRKLSYMRAQDIAAVLTDGGIVPEE